MNFFLISSLLLASSVFAENEKPTNDATILAEIKHTIDSLKNVLAKSIKEAIASCAQAPSSPSSSSSSSPFADSYVKPSSSGFSDAAMHPIVVELLKRATNNNRAQDSYSFPIYVNGPQPVPAGPSFLQAGAVSQGAYTVAQPAPVPVQYQAQPAPVQYNTQPAPVQYNTQPVPAPVSVATYGNVQQVAVPAPAQVPVGGQYATAPSAQYVSAKKK